MSDKQKISEYIDNLTFRKSLCMGFHPDEVYEAICNLTSMYNAVLSEAYDEADRLKEENEFLRRNADRLGAQPQIAVRPGEEEKKSDTEMVENMDVNLWGSTRLNTDTGFDKGLADMLSVIAQPEYKEESASAEMSSDTAADEVSEAPAAQTAAEDSLDENSEIAEEITPASEPADASSSAEKKPAAPRSALNDKQIQRLKRGELLEILIESSRENEKLRGQVDSLNDEIAGLNGMLSDRSIKIEKAGNLAEAALEIHHVMQSAQDAAAHYLEEIQNMRRETEEECRRLLEKTEKDAENIIALAREGKASYNAELEAIMKEFRPKK